MISLLRYLSFALYQHVWSLRLNGVLSRHATTKEIGKEMTAVCLRGQIQLIIIRYFPLEVDRLLLLHVLIIHC